MSADQGSKVSAEREAPSGDSVREKSAMKTSGREKSREQFDKQEESSPRGNETQAEDCGVKALS